MNSKLMRTLFFGVLLSSHAMTDAYGFSNKGTTKDGNNVTIERQEKSTNKGTEPKINTSNSSFKQTTQTKNITLDNNDSVTNKLEIEINELNRIKQQLKQESVSNNSKKQKLLQHIDKQIKLRQMKQKQQKQHNNKQPEQPSLQIFKQQHLEHNNQHNSQTHEQIYQQDKHNLHKLTRKRMPIRTVPQLINPRKQLPTMSPRKDQQHSTTQDKNHIPAPNVNIVQHHHVQEHPQTHKHAQQVSQQQIQLISAGQRMQPGFKTYQVQPQESVIQQVYPQQAITQQINPHNVMLQLQTQQNMIPPLYAQKAMLQQAYPPQTLVRQQLLRINRHPNTVRTAKQIGPQHILVPVSLDSAMRGQGILSDRIVVGNPLIRDHHLRRIHNGLNFVPVLPTQQPTANTTSKQTTTSTEQPPTTIPPSTTQPTTPSPPEYTTPLDKEHVKQTFYERSLTKQRLEIQKLQLEIRALQRDERNSLPEMEMDDAPPNKRAKFGRRRMMFPIVGR